jgi:hypothetical protein
MPPLSFEAAADGSPDTEEPCCLLPEVPLDGEGGMPVETEEDDESGAVGTPFNAAF